MSVRPTAIAPAAPGPNRPWPALRRPRALRRHAPRWLRQRLLWALLTCPALAAAPSVRAQPPGAEAPPVATDAAPRWTLVFSPAAQGDADLDRGGEVSANRVALALGRRFDGPAGVALDLGLRYEVDSWDFATPSVFGPAAPWERIHRVTLGLGGQHETAGGWRFGWQLGAGVAGERGARGRGSRQQGLALTAARDLAPNLSLGLGLGFTREIGETRVQVFPIVAWQIDDHWRLGNLMPTSAFGPTGLELAYRVDEQLSFGLGFASRRQRFRLDEDGPRPDGIGQAGSRPVFARATWRIDRQAQVELMAGVLTGGRLRLEDPLRRVVVEDDFDNAPFIGASFVKRF